MKNVHILSTSKPSRLHNTFNILRLEKGFELSHCNQNIYITSDEEIKVDEYYIHGNRLHKHLGKKCLDVLTNKEYPQSNLINKDSVFKKVILSTDQDLIKDGVQAIDDEFLEWYVNNPSCEEVEVQKWFDGVDFLEYKIIIPKEEPKQETLEEAEKEFEKLLNGKGLPTKQLLEVAEYYFIVGYELAKERRL